MIKTIVAFLESRLLSSQSEQFKTYSKSTDWSWKKAGPPKIHFCFDYVNSLLMLFPTLGPSSLPVVVVQPDESHANRTAVLEWFDKHRAYNTCFKQRSTD